MTNFQATSCITCDQGKKYAEALRKHFDLKVKTERGDEQSTVFFDMGQCQMQWPDGELHLHCSADQAEALDVVKQILVKHLAMFRDLKDRDIQWVHTPS